MPNHEPSYTCDCCAFAVHHFHGPHGACHGCAPERRHGYASCRAYEAEVRGTLVVRDPHLALVLSLFAVLAFCVPATYGLSRK